MTTNTARPTVIFFCINGNGLGHMSRCLAYARRIGDRARSVFFSNAAAIEIINEMGFEADYFVSPFSSRAKGQDWNRQLAVRFGLLLERVRPDAVLFDGTWPFPGLMSAISAYGKAHTQPKLIWSRRGLFRKGTMPVPVSEYLFDLVLEPGEIGTAHSIARADSLGRKVILPPVTLLEDRELLDRENARAELGLESDMKYALFSLGPGNLKSVDSIGAALIEALEQKGFKAVWAYAPISVRDVQLPSHATPLKAYPLPRYMHAFDVFIGAAGYNTCSEVLQTQVPSLLIPNAEVIDDQTKRAEMVARHAPVVVSPCETEEQRIDAIAELTRLTKHSQNKSNTISLEGARLAAAEILGPS